MPKTIKETIITDYTSIALYAAAQGVKSQRETICQAIYAPIDTLYQQQAGYIDEVNLGLGCGFPVDHAGIKPGDIVVDLGCGAGVDTFIAAAATGIDGKVIGIDITEKILQYAAYYAGKKQIKNVAFKQADMERIPLKDECVQVVISNGVFSLATDLDKVFTEVFRILVTGGVFCFSDMTCHGTFSDAVINNVKYFTGCINGISTQERYLEVLRKVGFSNIEIVDERTIPLPEDIIESSVEPDEYEELKSGARRFLITTIRAIK